MKKINVSLSIEIISMFNPKDRLEELENIPRCSNGDIDYWQCAKLLCQKDGGRLPTINELKLICSLQNTNMINSDYSGAFWSAAEYNRSGGGVVDFPGCNYRINYIKSLGYYVLCVGNIMKRSKK